MWFLSLSRSRYGCSWRWYLFIYFFYIYLKEYFILCTLYWKMFKLWNLLWCYCVYQGSKDTEPDFSGKFSFSWFWPKRDFCFSQSVRLCVNMFFQTFPMMLLVQGSKVTDTFLFSRFRQICANVVSWFWILDFGFWILQIFSKTGFRVLSNLYLCAFENNHLLHISWKFYWTFPRYVPTYIRKINIYYTYPGSFIEHFSRKSKKITFWSIFWSRVSRNQSKTPELEFSKICPYLYSKDKYLLHISRKFYRNYSKSSRENPKTPNSRFKFCPNRPQNWKNSI